MRIVIETVPKEKIRNEQVGDYFYLEDGTLQINVAEQENEKYESLIAIHELIEERLTKWRNISEPEISKFDEEYENKRKAGLVPQDSENGFASDCPYRKEHTIATSVEMLIAAEAGIDWNLYDNF